MIFRQLTSTGDFTFGKGRQNFAREEKAINLAILTTLRFWKGDCFFATQFGINWKEYLNYGQQEALNSALQTAILQCYGVLSINSAVATFDPVSRKLSAVYNIDTVYSQGVTSSLEVFTGTLAET